MVFLDIARSETKSFKKTTRNRTKSLRNKNELDRPSSEPGFHSTPSERRHEAWKADPSEVRAGLRGAQIQTNLNGPYPQSLPLSAGSAPPPKASKVLGVNDVCLNEMAAEHQRNRLSRRNPSRQSSKFGLSCPPIDADEASQPQQEAECGASAWDAHQGAAAAAVVAEAAGEPKQNARPNPSISHPSNFQHLTHTQPQHFTRMVSTNHNDLVTEFSVHRASQASRRDLRGIKAENLSSRSSSVDTAAVPSLASESSHDSLHSSCHHSPSSSQSFKASRTKRSFSLPFSAGQVPKVPVSEDQQHQQHQQQQQEQHQHQQQQQHHHHHHHHHQQQQQQSSIPKNTPTKNPQGHADSSWHVSQSDSALFELLPVSAEPASNGNDSSFHAGAGVSGPCSSVSAFGTSATVAGPPSPELSRQPIHSPLQVQLQAQLHQQQSQPEHRQHQQHQQHQQQQHHHYLHQTYRPGHFPLPVPSPPASAVGDVDCCRDTYHEYLRSLNHSHAHEVPGHLPSPAMASSFHGLETILPSVSEDDEGFATFSRSVRMVDLPANDGADGADGAEQLEYQSPVPSFRPDSQQSTSTITLSHARESLANQPPPKALRHHPDVFRFGYVDDHRVSMNRSSMTGGLFSSWAADSDSSSDDEFDATIESARNLSTLKEEDEESIRDSQNTIPEEKPPSRPTTPPKTSPPALTLETHLLDRSTSSLAEEIPNAGIDQSENKHQRDSANRYLNVAHRLIHHPEPEVKPSTEPPASTSTSPSDNFPMSPRSAMRDPQNTSKPRRRANTTGKSVRFDDAQNRSRSRSRSRSNQRQSQDIPDYSKIRANLEELQKSLAKLEMQASEPPSKDEISRVSEVLRVTKDLERSKSAQRSGHQRNKTISEPLAQVSAEQSPAAANAGKIRVPSPTRSRSRTLGTVSEFPSEQIAEQEETMINSTSTPRASNQKRPRDAPSPAASARFSVFPPLATKKPSSQPNP